MIIDRIAPGHEVWLKPDPQVIHSLGSVDLLWVRLQSDIFDVCTDGGRHA